MLVIILYINDLYNNKCLYYQTLSSFLESLVLKLSNLTWNWFEFSLFAKRRFIFYYQLFGNHFLMAENENVRTALLENYFRISNCFLR